MVRQAHHKPALSLSKGPPPPSPSTIEGGGVGGGSLLLNKLKLYPVLHDPGKGKGPNDHMINAEEVLP
jgi:hypothetical protein